MVPCHVVHAFHAHLPAPLLASYVCYPVHSALNTAVYHLSLRKQHDAIDTSPVPPTRPRSYV